MSSIVVVQPQSAPQTPASEVVTLQIILDEDDWSGYFDRLQVLRSRLGAQGPYEELTAPTMQAARIPNTASLPVTSPPTGALVALSGKQLELQVDEREDIVIEFTGSDPLSFTQAVAQVTAQGKGRVTAYVSATGTFVVTTLGVGTGSMLRVVGGDAAPQLGLPIDEPANTDWGEDARLPLTLGKEKYVFHDIRGNRAYFYKTRYLNSITGATSDYSRAFSAEDTVGISHANLVYGSVRLVRADGKPLCGQTVQVHMEYNGSIVEGSVVAGSDLQKKTDKDGRVLFTLVRGQNMAVAIPGTNLNRNIITPIDPEVAVFNLLDPSVGRDNDTYTVAVPQLVAAERMTL